MQQEPRRRDDPVSRAFRTVSRPFLFACGWFFLGVGIVGIVTPLIPGVLFLILAGACFTRSSPRFEAWLLAHPRFGPPVRQWRATRSIPRKAKWIACLSMAASWAFLYFSNAPDAVKIGVGAALLASAWYVATRPDGAPSA
jgi:uncharacterized membrane protein YbaN (DUF454 family)